MEFIYVKNRNKNYKEINLLVFNMRTEINFGRNISQVPLWRLEEIVKDVKSLAEREIEHPKRRIDLVVDEKVQERRIFVEIPYDTNGVIKYRVEDFGYDREDRQRYLSLGSEEYNSNDLKKTPPYHQFTDPRPAV